MTLDAGGYLLLGLKHLEKADEKLRDMPQTRRLGKAFTDTGYAISYTKAALEWFREEKEEPCR